MASELNRSGQSLTEDTESNQKKNKISRRDFLKYSAGVAAVAAGAAAVMDKLPFSTPLAAKSPSPNTVSSEEPTVVAVQGDELTLIRGERSVKIKDALLAAMLAGKAESEEE